MAEEISPDEYIQGLAKTEDPDPAHPVATADLLDRLEGLRVAFDRCNRFAVDPELSDRERAEFAAMSTHAFGIVRQMIGPSLCVFLEILHQPQTTAATKRETRAYLSGFLSDAELDSLSEDELCELLLGRLRERGFPVPSDG